MSNDKEDLSRDPAGFTGLAVLQNGRILVDDIVPDEAWAYFCEHILFKDADERGPGVGLAGIFMLGVQAYREMQVSDDIQESKRARGGYLYLMLDTRNGLFKIGVSLDAEERESTLQSQAPSIKLLDKVKLTLRSDCNKVERILHQQFALRRVRGEWFKLSTSEYDEALALAKQQAAALNNLQKD